MGANRPFCEEISLEFNAVPAHLISTSRAYRKTGQDQTAQTGAGKSGDSGGGVGGGQGREARSKADTRTSKSRVLESVGAGSKEVNYCNNYRLGVCVALGRHSAARAAAAVPFFSSLFPHPIYYFRPCSPAPSPVVTQSGGHKAGFSPPSTRHVGLVGEKLDVLRPGIVGMRGSKVTRPPPCVISSAPPPPLWYTPSMVIRLRSCIEHTHPLHGQTGRGACLAFFFSREEVSTFLPSPTRVICTSGKDGLHFALVDFYFLFPAWQLV